MKMISAAAVRVSTNRLIPWSVSCSMVGVFTDQLREHQPLSVVGNYQQDIKAHYLLVYL
jgi:hypothetical protein